jgi:hypothetical protein
VLWANLVAAADAKASVLADSTDESVAEG